MGNESLARIDAEIRQIERLVAQQDVVVLDALRRGLNSSEAEKTALLLRGSLDRAKANRRVCIRAMFLPTSTPPGRQTMGSV